ncbi:hypothetical protein CAOG_03194 [Capsaspora owczarzaki ATCC 30864]|uniref:GxGYxYP putative glycoside hydrolase N-terminal domain-containing protein n=1 Tax=Capsaspora owczarzaki (strain ATCC 30864) TaxID=595528 RepID=A0A0D2WNW5_CAPO3|nr:hypothetical protein CAOG_03194 [Capsaspora owczarzaki ATCC 30864]KJE92178.1 hypothetical protein CAOG_003194 [Capsaspora owczarzaki ATCC 30864]|eukprot:XP_004364033.1 hypothetical protein CAOG_03194 [Capsaspora owczarzaki ATCC 30864]
MRRGSIPARVAAVRASPKLTMTTPTMTKMMMMHMMMMMLVAVLVVLAGVGGQPAHAKRIAGSPYPSSPLPAAVVVTIDDAYLSVAQRVLVNTLQGQLARNGRPALYRFSSNSTLAGTSQDFVLWLEQAALSFGVTPDHSIERNLTAVLTRFRSSIAGFVLYDGANPSFGDSVNVALSVCAAVPGAIATDPTNVPLLQSLGLVQLYDVRASTGRSFDWALDTFGSAFSNTTITFQTTAMPDQLSDWTVFSQSFSYFITSDLNASATAKRAFSRLDQSPLAALFGWGVSENGLVGFASEHHAVVHAADWAINLSVLANLNVSSTFALTQKTHANDVPSPPPAVHTVCFLMTDGDNIQWLLTSFMAWYNTTAKGKTNLGWTISPALFELAPAVMQYLYDTASNGTTAGMPGRDFFVAAPSGLGYGYPNSLPNMAEFSTLTSDFMAATDLRIVNVITTDNDNPTNNLDSLIAEPNVDAVFLYPYDNYALLNGSLTWMNGKPVIGGRYNLWSGTFETPQTLAAKINALPRNIQSADSYTLIPVHVWTNSVQDVATCASLLQAGVDVVTPDVFVQRISKHVART